MRNPVAPQAVGDQAPGLILETGKQPLEETLGGGGVPPILDQDVEHDPLLIHRSPEVMQLAVDANEHLVQMPGVAWPRPSAPQLGRVARAELQALAPDALVAHHHAPFGQDQLDIPQAQAEHVIEPHGMADELGREAVPGVGGRVWHHLTSLAQPLRCDERLST